MNREIWLEWKQTTEHFFQYTKGFAFSWILYKRILLIRYRILILIQYFCCTLWRAMQVPSGLQVPHFKTDASPHAECQRDVYKKPRSKKRLNAFFTYSTWERIPCGERRWLVFENPRRAIGYQEVTF